MYLMLRSARRPRPEARRILMQPFRLRPELPALQAAIRVLLAGAALLALFSVPVFSTVLPPLFDYPNHLARFWLLLTGGNAFYELRWVPLPNLGGDLIVPLLAWLLPLDLAGKLFLVLGFALILGGAAWTDRVVSGGGGREPR